MRYLVAALYALPLLAKAESSVTVEARTDGRPMALYLNADIDLWQRSPWSVAAGFDLVHDRGAPYLELRYENDPWSAYVGFDGRDGPRAGGDLTVYDSPGFRAALGATLARRDDEVGTLGRYEVRFTWPLSRRYDVELVHESNCSKVCRVLHLPLPCGPTDQPNGGQNWFVVRYHL